MALANMEVDMSETELPASHEAAPRPLHKLRGWMSAVRLAVSDETLYILRIAIGVAIFSLVVWWLVRTTAVLENASPIKGDYYETLLYKVQRINLDHFELWYKLNIIIQCTLIVAALLAAIFASITTRENAERLKKWSVFLTAVTAAMASFQATFHIRENLDTFIQATADLNQLEADYLADRAKFAEELTDTAKIENNIKLLELHRSYIGRFNEVVGRRMHALTNVGQQASHNAGQQSISRGASAVSNVKP
jgi:hypothetical protein